MAQSGYTPILIYSSSTASQAPAAGNLTNSTLGSELAINITDGKLFYKDNGGSVQVIAWKVTPTTAGGTGLTSYTAGDTLYYATGTTLSKLAIGASKTIMTSSGTAPQWSASLDTTQGGTGLTAYTAGDLPYYATGTALSKLGIGSANTVLTSSGTAPQWTAQSSLSVGTAANLLSNATTGVMQIVGPGTGTTRVMTIPNANFTAARTDAGQTFSGAQSFDTSVTTTPNSTTSELSSYLVIFGGNNYYSGQLQLKDSANRTLVMRSPSGLINGQIGTSTGQDLEFITGNTTRWAISNSDGNLTQITAAKGINFTANSAAAGMTSQLLNWYEEGTWTPSLTSATGTITTVGAKTAYYTRIGRLVTLNMNVVITTNGTGATALLLGNLPFAISTTNTTGSGIEQAVTGKALAISSYNSTTLYVTFYDFTYPGANGARIVVSVTYPI